MKTSNRIEMAERVAAVVASYNGVSAKVWTGDTVVCVYLTRKLSRGVQAMGFIAIGDDGDREYGAVERNKAGVRDHVEAAIMETA